MKNHSAIGVQGTVLRMPFWCHHRHGRLARATDNPASTLVSRPDKQSELSARIDAIVGLGTMGAWHSLMAQFVAQCF